MTVDLRNTDWGMLPEAIAELDAFARATAEAEGCTASARTMAHFPPVAFDPTMVDLVENSARALGHSVRRMPSGAGHDAQMFAPNCPTAMIFVPSKDGISHAPSEYTSPEQITNGANVLLLTILGMDELLR